jgi:hypothetical protein
VAACSVSSTISSTSDPDEKLRRSSIGTGHSCCECRACRCRRRTRRSGRSAGRRVRQRRPWEGQSRPGFLAVLWFFTLQYNRNNLIVASPLSIYDLEQWVWMYERWAIAEAGYMSKDSELLHIVAKADALSVQIQDFHRGMSGTGSPTIPHALRSDMVQVMLRFSAVRSRWVSPGDGDLRRGQLLPGRD